MRVKPDPQVLRIPPGVSGEDFRKSWWTHGDGWRKGALKGAYVSAANKKPSMSDYGKRGAKAQASRRAWSKWTGDGPKREGRKS